MNTIYTLLKQSLMKLKHSYTQNLNSKKANDIFGMSVNFLKFAGDKIIQSFIFLINESIRNGIVPEKLKLVAVYPIYKKNSKMKGNSYRLISILHMISKIYKKMIHERLMFFFTKNITIHKHQFGFQKGNSERVILDICSSIFKAIDKHFKSTRKERKSMLDILRFCKGL